ncbi:MAG TPA: T9SS type A sorting domain-containing protein [Candidatus Kapabacteria bacterium]|nr:T9SS type A sorting domain-containing protein [Candidatus Kapabacteria bacterium]
MRKIVFVVFALTILIVSAKAQVVWNVTHSDDWWSASGNLDSNICFTSVSCNGDNCTAAGRLVADPNNIPEASIVIYRSNDGGKSWERQPFDIPFIGQTINHGITKLVQIDSLNVVGIADLGYVIRTTDGGQSWHKQTPPVYRNLIDIDFSTPSTGIVLGAGFDSLIFTTTDGGATWINRTISGSDFYSCRSFGSGAFRFYKYGHGPIYTTRDNFKTIDSSKEIFDSITDHGYHYLLMNCTYTAGDTILAYGKFWPKDTVDPFGGYGMIMRTTNGGNSWEKPFIYPTIKIGQVDQTTTLDRDTIYAAGLENYNFLRSTDRGATWQCDTILMDTSYNPYTCWGLTITGDGHPVASFSYIPIQYSSVLTRGEFVKSHVDVIEKIVYNTRIYPNPTSGKVNISSIVGSDPYRLVDIFGREVMSGKLSDQGTTTLDVSSLSQGMYELILYHFDLRFSAGKIVVMKN